MLLGARVGQLRAPVGKPALLAALFADFKDLARTSRVIAIEEPDFSSAAYRFPSATTSSSPPWTWPSSQNLGRPVMHLTQSLGRHEISAFYPSPQSLDRRLARRHGIGAGFNERAPPSGFRKTARSTVLHTSDHDSELPAV